MVGLKIELIDLQSGHFVESDPVSIGKQTPLEFFASEGKWLAGRLLAEANAPFGLYLVRITYGSDFLRYRFGKFYPSDGTFTDLGSENPYIKLK